MKEEKRRNLTNIHGETSERDRQTASGSCHLFSEDYRAALDNSNVPIYIIDPESYEMVYCNRAVCEYLAYNPAGMTCYKAMMNRKTPCENCVARNLYLKGDSSSIEITDPRGGWGLLHASSLDWKGHHLIQVTSMDITKQKELEAELRLRNREYAAIVRQSTTGVMRYNIATDTATVNVDRGLNQVEEYDIPDYSSSIHKSALLTAGSEEEASWIFRDIQNGRPSRGYDVQLSLPSGPRWFHIDYVLVENDQGQPDRAVIFFLENTKQREREMAYEKWNDRLNTLMDEYTVYMEVNLSRDIIEAEGRPGSWTQNTGGHCYSAYIEKLELDEIFLDDRLNFQKFFNRERLLGQFFAGISEGRLEYRAMTDNKPEWYRAEIQMVSAPSTREIKASIVVSNVDLDIRERERLKSKAERDIMTGLYNHATAETLIREVVEADSGENCCFLMIDLDDLRDINSCFGHLEGDRALKAVAAAMVAQFGESHILGRIGGDEFVALIRNAPDTAILRREVTAFMNRIGGILIGPDNDRPIRVSVGAATAAAGSVDFKTLYQQADLALYYTKAVGKNDFHFYEAKLEKQKFSYKPHSQVTLTKAESFDTIDMRKMMKAISWYFPLVISVNLTKNHYLMLEYTSYILQGADDEGDFDRFIEQGHRSFHAKDREGFINSLSRQALLQAYHKGELMVKHVGRQLGDDRNYYLAKTIAVFMRDERTGDICEVSFTHATLLGEETYESS